MSKKLLLNVSSYCLLTFPTTHSAMHAEKVLGEQDMAFIIVPVPKEISEGCGLAVRCHCEDVTGIIDKLKDCGIQVSDYYRIEKNSGKNLITRLSDKPQKES